MAISLNSVLQVALVVVLAASLRSVGAADPDPLSDNPSNTASFTFRGLGPNGSTTMSAGGRRAGLSTTLFPALTGQGITYVRFDLEPCSINEPHTHPRATELLVLVSGGPLQVGFVDTRSNLHVDLMYPGDVTIFPRGLMHYELNVGNQTALFYSALNSENPGTLPIANVLAQIPRRTLVAAMNVGPNGADAFKAAQPPANGMSTLMKLDSSVCTPNTRVTTME
ncbi:hypothetical protein KFL_006000030 [Klebsormidium nitens]|uniref:Germin-like protein n=1 Tax=Klebsormidium nitens TaxID=105231 RepID=A0A1Y1IKZ3_KLENI|nr:hypothetical protein KFL_006000030 [Klebsormidium nitens]|eukprot:GAQ90099.1 hypothetical protein KFL_006000030 [Klebsormidium nitens]